MSAARLPEEANASAIRSVPVMRRATYLVVAALLVVACGGEGSADPRGASVTRFEVRGPGGKPLEQIGILPAHTGSEEALPLLVLLHGRTDDLRGPDSMLTDALLRGLESLGPDAPAILLVNGGESSYFHDRRGGRWGDYVLRRAIPAGI